MNWINMPRRWLIISLPLIGATAFLTSFTVLSDEARIIHLKHRTAREIIPLIQPILGPYDAVTGTDYRLIIRTPEATFGEIERILLQVDVAQRRLQISVEQFAAEDRNQYQQSVSGSERIGDRARIVLPEKTPSEKGVVITKDNLRYSVTKSADAASNKNRQTVMTLDGQRAYIRIGQSVPQVTRILAISRKGAVIAQDVELRDMVSGFEVLPRVRGEHVRIEITPRLSTLENPGTGLVNFQELTTTVEAKLGEWIDLGSILGNRSEIHRAILESGAINSNERRIVRLRVE